MTLFFFIGFPLINILVAIEVCKFGLYAPKATYIINLLYPVSRPRAERRAYFAKKGRTCKGFYGGGPLNFQDGLWSMVLGHHRRPSSRYGLYQQSCVQL